MTSNYGHINSIPNEVEKHKYTLLYPIKQKKKY